MPIFYTPGVYFEKPRPREALQPQRTDVVGFVGLAERGPLHEPQRLTTWRQFQQLFGGFLSYSHLAYAVRAFFENGGRACWVVRVCDSDTALPATVAIPDDDGHPAYNVTAANPGTWGNALTISVQAASLAGTRHQPLSGLKANCLMVDNITGLEQGSMTRLTQSVGGSVVNISCRIEQIDVISGILAFDTDLVAKGLRPTSETDPINVQSLEFTLLVWRADQVIERFDKLAPDSRHTHGAVTIVNRQSNQIRLSAVNGSVLPKLPWRGTLNSGHNGLRTLNLFDYIGTPQGDQYGLAALAQIDEIGLLAMPDLTVRPQRPTPSKRQPSRRLDECALETPTRRVSISGRVIDNETGSPLSQVKIEANDGIAVHETVSGLDGRFILAHLLPGNIELVFNSEEYQEKIIQISSLDTGDVALVPLDLPPALSDMDIYAGQAAMIAQCEALRDRFALLDPPLDFQGNLLDINRLQAWRARFDTAFAALYYPWLRVNDPLQPGASQGRLIPPSGHIAGIIAQTDLTEGVFRPPANRALNWADDIGAVVNDATQGLLNPQGINVIRAFPGRGIRVFGSRTLSSDSAWRFINVRRLISMLVEAMHDGLQWAIFEPNDAKLRLGLRSVLVSMLDALWRRGALVGDTPDAAYRVRCDSVTTPPEEQANGRVITEVSVAPTVPYEFIVLRLGHTADELQISEV